MELSKSFQLLEEVSSSNYSKFRLYGRYNSQNSTKNQTSIELEARLYCNGNYVSFSSGTVKIAGSSTSLGSTTVNGGQEKVLKNYKFTVTHDSSGKYENKSTTASISTTGKVSASLKASISVPQIKRISVLNDISSFDISQSIKIGFVEYVSSYTEKLEILIGSIVVKTVSNISNSSSISFTDSEKEKIYSLMPNSITQSFTFKLTTLDGSSTIGSSSKTANGTIPSNIVPVIDKVEINDVYIGTLSKFENFVQNKSKIIGLITAKAGQGATIKSYSTSINKQTLTTPGFTTELLTESGDFSFTTTVTDTRGRKAEYNGQYKVLEYNDPTITLFDVDRCNEDGSLNVEGEYILINLQANIYPLINNDKTFKVQYKKATDESDVWQDLITYSDDYKFELVNKIFPGFSSDYEYIIRIVIIDFFNEIGRSTMLESAAVTMDLFEDGTGVAFGKVSDKKDTFEVAFTNSIFKDLYVDSSDKTKKLNVADYLFEYEVIGTYEGE